MLVKRAKENAGGDMEKIYKFKKEDISKNVPDKKGIYFLGNINDGKFVIGYVGRSDGSLKKRLLTHNHYGEFDFFSFQIVNSMREGFILETEYCNLLKGRTINRIHPNIPHSLIMESPADVLGRHLKKRFLGGKK